MVRTHYIVLQENDKSAARKAHGRDASFEHGVLVLTMKGKQSVFSDRVSVEESLER